MKRLFLVFCLALCLGATCNTSQQRTTFNTVSSLEIGVDSAYKAYLDLVVNGKVPTNAVPSISSKYETFQAAVRLGITTAQFTTNSPPTAVLTQGATDILTSINAAKGGK